LSEPPSDALPAARADAGSRPAATARAGFQLTSIWKRFGNLQVLADVSFGGRGGQVHALVGENGAGKTTLMRILAGLESADAGTVEVGGVDLPPAHSPRDALAAGVGLVPQHCEVVPGLSVLENLALGAERSRLGVLAKEDVRVSAQEVAHRLGFALDWNAPAESLGLGQRQRLELVRILWRDSSVLVLDEPTTVLTAGEIDGLFTVLRALADEGRTVIFITHKLREVRQVADDVTVLRAGCVVGRVPRAQIDLRELAQMMVGDVVGAPRLGRADHTGAARLSLRGVSTRRLAEGDRPLQGIDLEVRAGEIVGLAGVEGNGQSELCEAVLGLRPLAAGSIEIEGERADRLSVGSRRTRGLASIPADRIVEGVDREAPLWENVTATMIAGRGGGRFGLLNRRGLRARARRVLADVGVRGGIDLPARALSGGNIQRLVVGRELERAPAVLIAAHPTRGVDVRGIAFIHERLLALRRQGCAILVVSADLDELSQIADRVEVLYGGRIVGSYTPAQAEAADIGLMMSGARVP
jgi:general nucleoside transport system ATP-binding protein